MAIQQEQQTDKKSCKKESLLSGCKRNKQSIFLCDYVQNSAKKDFKPNTNDIKHKIYDRCSEKISVTSSCNTKVPASWIDAKRRKIMKDSSRSHKKAHSLLIKTNTCNTFIPS